MFLKELISQGWQALMRDRLRSATHHASIVWGLASVVLLLAYGQGLGGSVLHAFLNMGNNVIVLWPGQTSSRPVGSAQARRSIMNTKMSRQSGTNSHCACGKRGDRPQFGFKLGTRVVAIQVRGVEMPYGQMRKLTLEDGRYFDEADFADHRRVVISVNEGSQKYSRARPE